MKCLLLKMSDNVIKKTTRWLICQYSNISLMVEDTKIETHKGLLILNSNTWSNALGTHWLSPFYATRGIHCSVSRRRVVGHSPARQFWRPEAKNNSSYRSLPKKAELCRRVSWGESPFINRAHRPIRAPPIRDRGAVSYGPCQLVTKRKHLAAESWSVSIAVNVPKQTCTSRRRILL